MNTGAVAAGSPVTVEAALQILRQGGNAVDAAVAGQVAAGIAEPMLTGLAGAGLATFVIDGKPGVLDMFTAMPGRDRRSTAAVPDMVPIDMDFGPTTQRFMVGNGSVAVPSLGIGLAALHERFGRLPLSAVVAPAAQLAAQGVPIRPRVAQILELLWPICARSPHLVRTLGQDGASPRAGHIYRDVEMAQTIRAFGEQGASLFSTGRVAQSIVETLSGDSLLTKTDLQEYKPVFREPLQYRYRDATIFLPGPPSIAGLLVLQALRELEDHGLMGVPFGADQIRLMTAALTRIEQTKGRRMAQNLFLPGFVEGFLSAIAPMEDGEEWLKAPVPDPNLNGHTTHISVVDEDGNAVGITSSLGESCGSVAEGTGILINNFLGEEDVNPEGIQRQPGQRLLTMCCPTVVQRDDGETLVIGSGGSSRIRSAILHAIVYSVDHRMTPEQIVVAPRQHVEADQLSLEAEGRPEGTVPVVRSMFDDVRVFDERSMYFGGLNLAGRTAEGRFVGAGDPRRAGAFQTTHGNGNTRHQ